MQEILQTHEKEQIIGFTKRYLNNGFTRRDVFMELHDIEDPVSVKMAAKFMKCWDESVTAYNAEQSKKYPILAVKHMRKVLETRINDKKTLKEVITALEPNKEEEGLIRYAWHLELFNTKQ